MTAEALHHQGPNLLEEVALGIISSLSILRTDSHTSSEDTGGEDMVDGFLLVTGMADSLVGQTMFSQTI
jgi:hypothetical protein